MYVDLCLHVQPLYMYTSVCLCIRNIISMCFIMQSILAKLILYFVIVKKKYDSSMYLNLCVIVHKKKE